MLSSAAGAFRMVPAAPAVVVPDSLRPVVVAVLLTMISGFGDAYGFVHAAQVWSQDRLVPAAAVRSALGFGLGLALQWFAVRFLQQAGVRSVELQMMMQFALTIVGIAILSRSFFGWNMPDQAVAVGVLCGIAWLVARTSG
ncbi:MAG: hypothetical protein R2882_06455 [Gemmatimonadales bacterium]